MKTTILFDPVYSYTPVPDSAKDWLKIVYYTSYAEHISSGNEVSDPDLEGDKDARKTKAIVRYYSQKVALKPTKHIEYCNETAAIKSTKKI